MWVTTGNDTTRGDLLKGQSCENSSLSIVKNLCFPMCVGVNGSSTNPNLRHVNHAYRVNQPTAWREGAQREGTSQIGS